MKRWIREANLPFEPRPAVRWFAPDILWTAGVRVVLTSALSSFLDKRELQDGFAETTFTDLAHEDEAWVDYMSDTGDGFDATYTMASLLAAPVLEVGGEQLHRGRLLVLGGDEVYPVPGPNTYEDRLEGPFEAALPQGGADDTDELTMLAIPGNHDWYDGLTGFLRVFGRDRHIGRWHVVQKRSYFAVQLPHRWWIWGLDIQLDSYIDAPQFDFFDACAAKMTPKDQLVVVTAVPSWIDVERDPAATRNLDYLERKIIDARGLTLRATIAGNSHHYARYTQGDVQRITSGGGGAFLHPTHDLPCEIRLKPDPRLPTTADGKQRSTPLVLQADSCYPDQRTSRRLALFTLLLFARNVRFVAIPGFVCFVLLWSNHFGNRSLTASTGAATEIRVQDLGWDEYVGATFRTPTSLAVVTLLVAFFVALAESPPWAGAGRPKWAMKGVMGLTHFAAQYVVILITTLLVIDLVARIAEGSWFVAWVSLAALVVGGIASSLVLGAYLVFWNAVPKLRTHSNAAFAASRLSRHKNFLRLHVESDGNLTIYAIGVRRVCRKWKPTVKPRPGEPLVMPAKELPRPHLIDRIRLEPSATVRR